jgi:nucleoid-associated protein YgaU
VALSVKLSLCICLGFIGGMTWLVDRVGQPEFALPVNAAAELPVLTAERALEAPALARFAWPSAVEPVAAERADAPRLVIAPPAETETPVSSYLPPLAALESEVPVVRLASYEADEVLVAAWPPAEPAVEAAPVVEDAAVAAPVVTEYVVQRGDSLARIARREWSKAGPEQLELLLAANEHLRERPHRLLAGETIVIPDPAAASSLARSASPKDPVVPSAHAVETAAVEAPATAGAAWYTIQERDTLSSIARRLLNDERRWVEIKRLNGLEKEGRLMPGMRIKLPPPLALANG